MRVLDGLVELDHHVRPLPPLAVAREVCTDFSRSSKLEWLESAGDGSFAMGTVAGVRTRRYHGLLVAALRPPVDRHVLLAGLEEHVQAQVPGLPAAALSTAQYPGTLAPAGYARLVEFRLDPFPTWIYDVGGAHVEKELFLVHGEPTVVVRWRCTARRELRVSPFLALRDYHSLARARGPWDGRVAEEQGPGALALRVQPAPGLPALHLQAGPAASFAHDGCWYFNHEVLEEQARGLDFQEDLWKAGTLTFQLEPGEPVFLAASLGGRPLDGAAVEALAMRERARRRPEADEPFRARLELAADQFTARRADGKPTLLAGYPWFTDWGRDTMIALPGLLIARGRLDEAREVLRGFLGAMDRGLLPNRFPDRPGEPLEYNTVDATLWLFQAVRAWLQAGGDPAFLRDELYPAAREILDWHRRGTHHGIRVDPRDGLLAAGAPGVQLTWMDARVGDRVITPRHGKPVEINALWYNALRLMAHWAQALGECSASQAWSREADRVQASFEAAFWNPARGCLFDVVSDAGNDPAVRPNQLFAVGLPFPLLSPARRRAVVLTAQAELLTEVGLRTLAPGEPGYTPHYRGGVAERDGAYHQGTVWPWLLGPFVRAWLAAFGRTPEALGYCRSLLAGLERRLGEGCLGQVGEVFDAQAPHLPGGAPAQAWSVAELLQLVAVDLAPQEPGRRRRGAALPDEPHRAQEALR